MLMEEKDWLLTLCVYGLLCHVDPVAMHCVFYLYVLFFPFALLAFCL